MFIREARAAAAQALRRHTRVLVVLALLLGTAYAAELVATGPSASHRTTADALARTPAAGLGHDRATAASSHATARRTAPASASARPSRSAPARSSWRGRRVATMPVSHLSGVCCTATSPVVAPLPSD